MLSGLSKYSGSNPLWHQKLSLLTKEQSVLAKRSKLKYEKRGIVTRPYMMSYKNRQAKRWRHLAAFSCSDQGIAPGGGGVTCWRGWGTVHMPHLMQTYTTRWLHACASSFNNRRPCVKTKKVNLSRRRRCRCMKEGGNHYYSDAEKIWAKRHWFIWSPDIKNWDRFDSM